MKCLLCSVDFFNFDSGSVISCDGRCGQQAHERCITKYQEDNTSPRIRAVRQNGTIQFTCLNCLKNDNQVTSDLKNVSAKINECTISELYSVVRSLVDEVRELKEVNSQLKSEIGRLNNAVSLLKRDQGLQVRGVRPTRLAERSPARGVMVAGGAGRAGGDVSSLGFDGAARAADLNFPGTSSALAHGETASLSLNGEEVLDGFKIISNRRRSFVKPPPLVGTKSSSTALKASERRPTRSLFISRLSTETTSDDVTSYMKDELHVVPIKCTPLKTKFNTYNSFHIVVDANNFDKVNNCDAWPSGVMAKPFFGRLYDDMIRGNSDIGDKSIINDTHSQNP